MHSLLDGDIYVYRAGFACQDKDEEGEVVAEPLPFALHTVKMMLEKTLSSTMADSFQIFLTGKDNFRNKVDPLYKISRKDSPKPVHYDAIREYMINNWQAEVIDGMEADDALGLAQDSTTTICSIDKDLLMVEGSHYNFVKDEWSYTDAEYGTFLFYKQMLTGDNTDDIPGIYGLGDKKASALLEQSDDWDGLVYERYKEFFKDKALKRMKQNALLLWIKQADKSIPIDWKRIRHA